MHHQAQTHEETAEQGGLLQAVLANPGLRAQLEMMPAEERTLAVSAGVDDPPALNSAQPSIAEFETIELPEAAYGDDAQRRDSGFVPTRQLAMLGEGSRQDVEYRLVGRLGSGGTGVVFQAHQRAIDREVAIKVLRDELARDQLSRDRFLTEARVIGGLDHPNVIALHEVCLDQAGSLFYSMKRIDGTSWDQQIADKSEEENIEILLRVADAIRYAHSRGLIHRDIKPENVMLGRFGEVLLADWGLAISGDPRDASTADHHSVGGTPAYMPPELAVGGRLQISFETDVYLLGATLYQILTGFPPHHGENVLACIQAAAHNVIRPSPVEGELMDIAIKAMATDPVDRYRTVEAMIAALADQRKHQQSVRLARRACEKMTRASNQDDYQDYRVADALLMEALEIWPENERAQQGREKLQLGFARAATQRGDLDLALSLYDALGQGDSPEANEVRAKRESRDASGHQASRYSALFTQSPEAGLLIQMSTATVVETNEMFGTLFGYAKDEVVGRRMSDLNLWDCPERRHMVVEELNRTGQIENFEARFRHTDGHAIDVLLSGRVVEMHGEPMVVSTIRDISKLKRAQTELKRSRQRLRDMQSLAGLATWSFDVATEKITWSEEAFLLTDRRFEDGEPTREEYLELVHPEDRQILKDSIGSALDSGAAYEVHIRQRGARGRYKRVLVRGQPIFDDDGKTVEIYGVVIPDRSRR